MNEPTHAPRTDEPLVGQAAREVGEQLAADRFTWGLILDVFRVLNEHGYIRGSNGDIGHAVGVLMDLVKAYEGTEGGGPR